MLSDFISFNPRESLSKDKIAKKIAMEQLQPLTRKISAYELSEYSGGAKFRNGDTLLARITPCLENGKTAKVTVLGDDEVAFGSTEYIVLRAKPGISDPDFVYYLAICPAFRDIAIKSMIGTTGRQRVQQDVLEKAELPIPDLPTQKAIGTVLSCLDDKIELNAQINQNLEAQAKAIFKSWFIDFEPFQDGEFIDSELGKIPKGWEKTTLSSLTSYRSNRISVSMLSLKNYISTESMIAYRGGIQFASSLPTIDFVTAFQPDDILVSNIRPYFKKIWYASFPGGCSNDVICFAPKKKIYSEYLFCLMNEDLFFDYVMGGSKGTKMPRGDKSQIMQYSVVLAPQHIMEQFSILIKPFLMQIRSSNEEKRSLVQLRDTLLPKLMSGEIDVSEVAI